MKLHLPPALRRNLIKVITAVGIGATCIPAEAGIMHEDASLQTYTDFGQNKGRYVTGTRVNALLQHIRDNVDQGIVIHYTDGTAPYTISGEQGMINFSATDDIGAQVAISPTFAATVLHNGTINASYGNREVGAAHAINYISADIRGSNVFRLAAPNGYDYMLQRQVKIVTDAEYIPVTGITDMDTLDKSLLYHSGAGGMGQWAEGGGKRGLAGPYAYIIGGINTITDAQTHANGTGTNISIHQNPGYGNGVGADATNPLPNAVQGGDSGSPVFIYNESSGQYEYLAAQQSGGGNSYSQARGDVQWTHEILESFNTRVNTGTSGVIKLGAIDTEGQSYTDNKGYSTTEYSGAVIDAEGRELGRYRGVKSGLSTWSDLSDVKNKDNWYAYTGHLSQPVTDLFFNDNLVLTAGAAKNRVELQATVDLGAGYVEFDRGNLEHARFDITSAEGTNYLLNSAGYVVNEGVSVYVHQTNPDNHMYEWRKTGAGDLHIVGSGDTNALLTLGGSGTTYLQREGGHAAYNVLVSSGATVVINDVGQIERSFTFGAGGGTLDMNGNSMDWYRTTAGEEHFSIKALTEQAIITNTGNRESVLTYRDGGSSTYAGSWKDSATGALRIDYQGGGIWLLNSIHTDLQNHEASGLTVSNGTVVLSGSNTVHGMGSAVGTNTNRLVVADDWHYADAAMDVTVKNGATFELASHARLQGDVTVEEGGTFVMREGVQNRYEYVEGGALREDTYQYADFYGLKGNVKLAGDMKVEHSAGTTADIVYKGSISGNGSLTVDVGNTGSTLTLSGNNSGFSGTKRVASGGLILNSASAAGDVSANKWVVDAPAWLAVNGVKDAATLLSLVDGSSGGTLALTGHMTSDLNLSGHRSLYIGAAEGRKLMFGDVMGYSSLQAQDGAWRLGGGGGELSVYYGLKGNGNLLLGADAVATGVVSLNNPDNTFRGDVLFNSRGILLNVVEEGALGQSVVRLGYGNRMSAPFADVLTNVGKDSAGMLMMDDMGSADIDLGNHTQLSLAAQNNATLSGSITLAEGAVYRLSAADGATLTVQSSLEKDRDIVVDGQGYSGGKVVLKGNEQMNGSITVQGSREGESGGEITLAIGRDFRAAGEVILNEGGNIDLAGHKLSICHELTGNGGTVRDSAGTGLLEFDTFARAISTAANLQVTTAQKVGHRDLVLSGSNSFDTFYVKSGALTLANSAAGGSGTVHLANSTSLNVGSGTFHMQLAMAENGGTASVVQTDGASTVLNGSIRLGQGSRLHLTGTGQYSLGSGTFGGDGAEIHVGTDRLNFASAGAVTIGGALVTDHNLTLYSDGTASNRARHIGELRLNNNATVTLDETTASTAWQIGSLSGAGKLVWNAGSKIDDYNSRLILSGEGDFTGNIELVRVYSNTPTSHAAIIELAHHHAARNATITLTGNSGSAGIATLAVNTDNAIIRGLSGTNKSYVYAGAAQVNGAIDYEKQQRPATTRAATLTIDTAGGTQYTYAGDMGYSQDTLAKGLSLEKRGSGVQNITGHAYLNHITAHGGTLNLSGEVTIRGNVGVGYGATLSAGDYILGEGQQFAVLGGETGATGPATFNGQLTLAGGTLYIDGAALLAAHRNGTSAFSVGGVGVADTAGNYVVQFGNFYGLSAGTYALAEGDWGDVADLLSADGLGIFSGEFSTADSGALQVTLTLDQNLREWQGGTTGTWDTESTNWKAGDAAAVFAAGQTAYFTTSANVNVANGVQVQNLVLGNGVHLTTNAGIDVSGVVMAGEGSQWTIAAGTQALTEAQAAEVGNIQVAQGARLNLTGSLTKAALDNVSGSGTVALNYAVNGNGTGFDFSGLTGTVLLEKGRILVNESVFGEQAPTLSLSSGNSQLVFNGTGTVLNSNVELSAGTTIHTNRDKSGVIAGIISGKGGLTKAGGGTLTFTAANTYTGATNISAGKLVLDLAAGNGSNTYTLHNNIAGGTLAVQEGTTLNANGKNIASNLELNGGELLVSGGDTTVKGQVSGEGSRISLGTEGSQTYENGGTLTFEGTVTASEIEAGHGQVVFAGSKNSVATIDADLNGKALGQVVVNTNAALHVTDSIHLSAENGGTAAIEVQQGGTLTHAGLTISGLEEGSAATLRADSGRGQYSTEHSDYSITGAHVAKVAQGDMEVGNRLAGSVVQNANTGTLAVTNSANTLSGVQATGGSITLLNRAEHRLDWLEVAAGQQVSAYSADAGSALATIHGTGTVVMGAGSVLNAHLSLADNSILALDGAATLNGSLTLGSGIALGGDIYASLSTLAAGDTLLLMNGLTALTLNGAENPTITLNSEVLADVCFSNLPEGCYLVYEEGTSGEGGMLSLKVVTPFSAEELTTPVLNARYSAAAMTYSAASGAVPSNMALVPEPTTATLSLLALAAIAARRRRSE